MKKILIFYASYGGGHLSAAKSIENVINTNYKDTQTKLIDCMKYVNKGVEKLTTAAYRQMAKKAPWAWGHIYSASQKGTTITVSNLFFNTPVRYKFLKKDFTEAGYIEDAVTRIAIANPNIAIKLINGNKTIIQTNGGTIQSR